MIKYYSPHTKYHAMVFLDILIYLRKELMSMVIIEQMNCDHWRQQLCSGRKAHISKVTVGSMVRPGEIMCGGGEAVCCEMKQQ